jgi:phage N-6-adenine-methyltransferase
VSKKGQINFCNRTEGKDEWLTPKWITDVLGPFDLDPCSPINRPWDTARKYYTIEDDGLLQPWQGFVWCNPPYGNKTGVWMRKLAQHKDGGIALVFCRPGTAWFQDEVFCQATAILFLRGRINFYDIRGVEAKHNAGADSVLIAFGTEAVRRLMRIIDNGHIVFLRMITDLKEEKPKQNDLFE